MRQEFKKWKIQLHCITCPEELAEDNRRLYYIKAYYKLKDGRPGLGWSGRYKRLKETFINNLSEHFLESEIEEIIANYVKSYIINSPIIAVEISSDFGEQRQELIITKRYIEPNDPQTHDRTIPETDLLLFNSEADVTSFIMFLKTKLGGSDVNDYKFIIRDGL